MNFVQEGKASIIIDGQWGSTGKGLLAAYLAQQKVNDVHIATTNASANAGHTTVLEDGKKFVTYHLPTFAVMQSNCYAYLNAGSIIDPDLLMKELDAVKFNRKKLLIHPHAAVITAEDKLSEASPDSSNTQISSTQKGVGTALARKIRRDAQLAKDHPLLKDYIRKVDLNAHTCVIEVPQGFDLSLNSGNNYPYVTSREITVSSALADAGLHPSKLGKVCMSIRTYPIRVGSIEGYTSGPHYEDQKEMKWEDLGVEPEMTTVTKRIRRVFSFSSFQYQKALKALRPDIVFVNFMNYLDPTTQWDKMTYELMQAEMAAGIIPKKLWGVGAKINEVFEEYLEAMNYMVQETQND